jgi:hypothetical protein
MARYDEQVDSFLIRLMKLSVACTDKDELALIDHLDGMLTQVQKNDTLDSSLLSTAYHKVRGDAILSDKYLSTISFLNGYHSSDYLAASPPANQRNVYVPVRRFRPAGNIRQSL